VSERGDGVPDARMTRGRFLAALALAGVAGGGVLGCGAVGRVRSLYPPRPNGGEWAFRSRPDLRPPAVSVARRSERTAPGYVFVAPKNGPGEAGPGQRGPLIVDEDGRPVWFRPLRGDDVDAMDFKAQRYRGKPVLTWWQGPHTAYGLGEYAVLDGSYGEVARVRAGGGYQADLHELLITGQDTALITIYGLTPHDLSPVGGAVTGVAAEGIVQELDIESGEVLFEWHSLERVGIEESYFPPPEDPAEPFDYFHINSIDVDTDGNLIISARKTSATYKIDRKSGEVLWRLDGKRGDFEMTPGTLTRYQHDARRRPDGTLTIFDNGEEGERAVPGHSREARRGGHEGQPGLRVRPQRAPNLRHPGQHADPAQRQRVRRLGQRTGLLRVPRGRRAPLRRELPAGGRVLPGLPVPVGREARRPARRGGRAGTLP
jgi:hypothetical protein